MNERMEKLHAWIQIDLGIRQYDLKPASEDASFRRYFRLFAGDETSIIMDAPPAREDCKPFIDIAGRLQAAGVHVPEVLHVNLEEGFIHLGDLGEVLYLDRLNGDTADTLYKDAIASIVRIQEAGDCRGLPVFNREFLLAEMALFRDWLLGSHLNIVVDGKEARQLDAVFDLLVENALQQPQVFVHRDYHSRNLMVTRINNPGIIDFQDAMRGPVTYDLVSLLKDCYVKWPQAHVIGWAREYLEQQNGQALDWNRFARWFDLMGVQRHLKASGIFARLYHRDQKNGFLKDIPRTLSYIEELSGQYPELEFLAGLIRSRVLPLLAEVSQACGP